MDRNSQYEMFQYIVTVRSAAKAAKLLGEPLPLFEWNEITFIGLSPSLLDNRTRKDPKYVVSKL